MKKTISMYSIVWVICVILFNVIVFLTPKEIVGINKFDGSFWIAYTFVTLAFVGQYVCTLIAFRGDATKLFYNIPLLSISYDSLVAMLIVGTIFIVIPALPNWIAIIVCVVILSIYAIAVIKAIAVADIVSDVDNKVKAKTFFIKSLTIEAETMLNQASSEDMKVLVKKIYEEFRYSDPMSHEALAHTESGITTAFEEFSNAVAEHNVELAQKYANQLIVLIKNRNEKCKLLK